MIDDDDDDDMPVCLPFCLQVYIRNCGSHRIELGQQMFVMKRLESVAEGETYKRCWALLRPYRWQEFCYTFSSRCEARLYEGCSERDPQATVSYCPILSCISDDQLITYASLSSLMHACMDHFGIGWMRSCCPAISSFHSTLLSMWVVPAH